MKRVKKEKREWRKTRVIISIEFYSKSRNVLLITVKAFMRFLSKNYKETFKISDEEETLAEETESEYEASRRSSRKRKVTQGSNISQ